ncbi:MAG: DNA polymerase I [Polyangiaceae bacterium]|nr:DNA polymerase I [Polyangiaceae bacterium]
MAATELPPAGADDVLYLVDLSGYVFRAYHAIPPLTSPSGEPTNATYGTLTMLHKLVAERRPAYLAVAMDSPGRGFRGALAPSYKAHRPPAPEDLKVQMARCRELVDAYHIPVFFAEGFEADDLVATAVRVARAAGLRVVIASSDKDLMQLVDDERVVVWDPKDDRVFGPPEVQAKFGVPPGQMRELLALVGDSSDNVAGVPGVGPKTAAALLAEHGSLDAIFANLERVTRPKQRQALAEHEADARLAYELVGLRADVPLELDLAALRYGGADVERLRALFTELRFTRFLDGLGALSGDEVSRPAPASARPRSAAVHEVRAHVVLELGVLEALAARARKAGKLALAALGSHPEPMRAELVGLALAVEPGAPHYVPLAHRYLGAPAQLERAAVARVLGPLLADPAIGKLGHDLKTSAVLLAQAGLPVRGARFDSLLAAYLLDPEAVHGLAELALRDAHLRLAPLELEAGKRGRPAETVAVAAIERVSDFAAGQAEAPLALEARYERALAEAGLGKLFTELEVPLSEVLTAMELAGVLVDPAPLAKLGAELGRELAALEVRAHEAAGEAFNVGSPKQLEAILFDKLGLRPTRKTKTGRSTDAEALEGLEDAHPLPRLVLEHRALAKLRGTYVETLPRLVHPETGRIHTRWDQAVAATGRLSSKDPNLQNIPIRSEHGKRIREAFVAPPGKLILSADYSQIELRVLAHLSGDEVLCDAFQRAQDVHVRTAMEVFGVDAAGVTAEMRRRSKTINFGIIYGMGSLALSKRLGIPRAEAERFIAAYFARYAGVERFMQETLAEARRQGGVRTLLGRRRLLPDLASSNGMKRSYAERIAQNTPIQGTAADILKLAMVRLAEPVVPGARMVLTVHDELVLEVPEADVARAAERTRTAMQSVLPLAVPLVVDVGSGKTWADAH